MPQYPIPINTLEALPRIESLPCPAAVLNVFSTSRQFFGKAKVLRWKSIARMFSLLLCIVSVLAVTVQSVLPTSELFFFETFDDVDPFSSGNWLKSLDDKYKDQPLLIKSLSSPIKGKLRTAIKQGWLGKSGRTF